ncbi:MAG: glycosyltransferase [Cyclobacteriaceae bacterium]|nr:glycosyltransferase [Cyclobacteriaceae bacterium HetDA_MAG_MS6]
MPEFSVIVPVYNRPVEIDELLTSLKNQSYSNFEVLIIEDGSSVPCEDIVKKHAKELDVRYFFKENSGQGFSRNFGFERAKGNYLIVFDSDCLIPSHYFQTISEYLEKHRLDAFGGPDRSHQNFTSVQKAISYSMTSFLTTGGIRGKKDHIGAFHPRSFNMGISKEVFAKTKGYILPKKGEDIEFSIRIIENGFKTGLIEEAYVYHKRRTSFRQFFKQLHFFGTARINIGRFYPQEVKWVHWFPSIFMVGLVTSVLLLAILPWLGQLGLAVYGIYFSVLFIHALLTEKSLKVALLSVVAAFIQLNAYGLGFIQEGFVYVLRDK